MAWSGSTQNLIGNAGFSLPFDSPEGGWQKPDAASWPERVPTPPFDRSGLPQGSTAVVLAEGTSPALTQTITLPQAATRQWAFRVTARVKASGDCVLSIRTADDGGNGRTLGERTFDLTPGWQRCRIAFKATAGQHCQVEVRSRTGRAVEVTDVRLVGLQNPVPEVAIRFDTRGDMQLPSSRLRAFMIEDQLNLLGFRTRLNSGRDHDLLICQKVTPFATLLSTRRRGGRVIYDLDDNEFFGSRLRAARIRLFARLADRITTGSVYLQECLSRPGLPAYLFDNPVDILDRSIRHRSRDWRGRLVWFGMPENAWMLDALGGPARVTRITRGGDVAYDLRTIDNELTGHDLAVLPMTLTEHSRAKNANRLIKCVGLGLPFLASDTPENRRALEMLGLDSDMLVGEHENWADRIATVGREYGAYKDAVAAARPAAFTVFGVETIVAGWLSFCEKVLARRVA